MKPHEPYPRDLVGHAGRAPHPHWPDEARIAVSLVLNYEEGGEACILQRRCALRIGAHRSRCRTR